MGTAPAPASTARQAMVDAAERLVAERGIGAVSLREVQVTAGQRNKSAAHYHFGSRDGLIEAVVESRMTPINQRRLTMLADLDEAGRGDDLRSLVEALVRPLAEATLDRPGSYYARFLAQAIADPSVSELVARHLRAESFRVLLERLLDHAGRAKRLPDALLASHLDRVVTTAIISLAGWEGGRFVDDLPMEVRVADLVDGCVALVEAPVSDVTRRLLEDLPATTTSAPTAEGEA